MDPWLFLPIGYVFTILVETPVLMLLLSSRHSLNTRLVAGIWLSACTYPVVVLVLPQVFDIANDRLTYLLVAETFAPLAECALFWLAFEMRRRAACTVLDKRIAEEPGPGNLYRPEVLIKYRVADRDYQTWTRDAPHLYSNDRAAVQKQLDELPLGDRPCWYDAMAPERAVVLPPSRWPMLQDMIAIVVANLASFGLGELIYASGAFEWLRDQLGY
jgi:hypothetical protein